MGDIWYLDVSDLLTNSGNPASVLNSWAIWLASLSIWEAASRRSSAERQVILLLKTRKEYMWGREFQDVTLFRNMKNTGRFSEKVFILPSSKKTILIFYAIDFLKWNFISTRSSAIMTKSDISSLCFKWFSRFNEQHCFNIWQPFPVKNISVTL